MDPPAPTFKDTAAFAAARRLHSSLLATRCPPLCLTPSWSLGTFLAMLRLSSDSASSWQFSTLLATWCTFPCSGVLLAVRQVWHLPVYAPPPGHLAQGGGGRMNMKIKVSGKIPKTSRWYRLSRHVTKSLEWAWNEVLEPRLDSSAAQSA